MTTLTVTSSADNGPGTLRALLAVASAGDTINFAVSTVDLASSLVITKNVVIDGAQSGSTAPAVTINGGGSGSNFSDFTIDAGVLAAFESLIIANGNAVGGHGGYSGSDGGTGGGAAGGIYDAGSVLLQYSVLLNDTATGGVGGVGGFGFGGGAGGTAAGGIYVASTGTLTMVNGDQFSGNSAIGGIGGTGGTGELRTETGTTFYTGGAGGAGGISGVTDGVGSAGQYGGSSAVSRGAGGTPGQPGGSGLQATQGTTFQRGAGGGGGGGSAFANVGGAGIITGPEILVVTNESDSADTVGSLRYELAVARAGDTIVFDPSVTTIDLSSSLVIATNVTIEDVTANKQGVPGVTINGGGPSSNFSDFTVNAGVTATLDGLIIANGDANGADGAAPSGFHPNTNGGAAAGGIYDAGTLTLANSTLQNDTAAGGAGGTAQIQYGGGAGGSAAGGIYVAGTGTLNLAPSDSFSGNSAVGGAGGAGGSGEVNGQTSSAGGAGGAGGVIGVSGGVGTSGQSGSGLLSGAGGAPGQPGSSGAESLSGGTARGAGGGGGGGSAFPDSGGKGVINAGTNVVTNDSDDARTVGSLRYVIEHAQAGATITFAPWVTTIDLSASLAIGQSITIEGAQPGSSTPGVTINGAGANSTDFVINAGVTATFDGLIIENGHASGAEGASGSGYYGTGSTGGAAAGGIYDAGSLTLTNSVLQNDSATGGTGGYGVYVPVSGIFGGGGGGGAGGNAAGAIYVSGTGHLDLAVSDSFSNDSAVGGAGGNGGGGKILSQYFLSGGNGGAGGVPNVNGGLGSSGSSALFYAPSNGAGGAPGQPGSPGVNEGFYGGVGGGGGGGTAFADVGGAGSISGVATDVVTNSSGNINTVGSLLYELAIARAGDTITFASNVTTIHLSSTLTIAENIAIEGAQPGSTTPGVTIDGGGSSSNFSDFTIDSGVTASFDGLIIADGHGVGSAGGTGTGAYDAGGTGYGAGGGIYDAGSLTLTNSILQDDTATGGTGGSGTYFSGRGGGGGGAGGTAAGGIYVTSGGSLLLAQSDSFTDNSATGGAGGSGGGGNAGTVTNFVPTGAAGGAGGTTSTGGIGSPGSADSYSNAGAGGAPGQTGSAGNFIDNYGGVGGGGGGGNAFADVGGLGTIGAADASSGRVTNESDDVNTVGSLRYELAHASAGETITFESGIATIDLGSTLTISTSVTIDGLQTGSAMPGVTINGGGGTSNFSDFTIGAGATVTLDGLNIENGNATGAAGHYRGNSHAGAGYAAAGGIYDAGSLTLSNSYLQNDTATGGVGGYGIDNYGGGAGGTAAGAIYVASSATLSLSDDRFAGNSAVGGAGGQGSNGIPSSSYSGGAGGAGGVSGVNGGIGTAGQSGTGMGASAGGAPGQPGFTHGFVGFPQGSAGGGGGGTAYADVGGSGAISITNGMVTNASDDINTFGSLRYELAHIATGGTITFASNVTTIDLTSSLVISKNVTIEGLPAGSTTPGVTIDGGGSGSNFSDFTISAGVTATLDGLTIENGNATGAAGHYRGSGYAGAGQAAAGGVYDAGSLTLTNSYLRDDIATGGVGGNGSGNYGGGAGGAAAGAIYVASSGALHYSADSFAGNSAVGGAGGQGSNGSYYGGAGGAGGISSVNGGIGTAGQSGTGLGSSPGGAPGQPGFSHGFAGFPEGSAGGGGGGTAFADIGGTGTINGPVPCYCPGTRIRIARGHKRVEKLKIGDQVMTASGLLRPIKWIGRRSYGGRFIRGNKEVLPICIRAGALDDKVPRRDLWLSPHHAMYLEGVLIEAKDLLNGISIVQAEQVDAVDYFHVELDTHDVIIAEGALAESYIDDDNRAMFHNASDYDALYPGEAEHPAGYCAPRLDEGYAVDEARRRIALRAGLLRAADAPFVAPLRGAIERVTPRRVEGWAYCGEHPGTPVCLDVFAGERWIGRVLANRYRRDLARAGIGDGGHGFVFTLPAGTEIDLYSISARRSLDGAALALSA